MVFKNLSIFGFKSFSNRTSIDFPDGTTAIVGPNGCGKSNIVDALRWVVGEQSVKSLRGEKMEDVIFNGTSKKPAVGLAEVTLTIDNSSNILPIDAAEVSITRRLFRSGDSEYLINRTLCKYRDVINLFLDTGVGKSAYSVMEQGKIDMILSTKPENRRYLFEEAAGITRYKIKKRESERKLKSTVEKLAIHAARMDELKNTLDRLKQQAEATLKYRKLKSTIREQDILINLSKYSLIEEELNGQQNRVEKFEAEEKLSRTELIDIQNLMDSSNRELKEHENSLRKNQEALYAANLQIKDSEHEISRLRQQHNHLLKAQALDKSNRENIKHQLFEIEETINIGGDENEDLNDQIGEYSTIVDEVSADIAENETSTGELNSNIEKYRIQIKGLNKRHIDLQKSQKVALNKFIQELDNIQGDLQKLSPQGTEDLPELQAIVSDIITNLKQEHNAINQSMANGTKTIEQLLSDHNIAVFMGKILVRLKDNLPLYLNRLEKYYHQTKDFFDSQTSLHKLFFGEEASYQQKVMVEENIIKMSDDKIIIESEVEILTQELTNLNKIHKMQINSLHETQINLTRLEEKQRIFEKENLRLEDKKKELLIESEELDELLANMEDQDEKLQAQILDAVTLLGNNNNQLKDIEKHISTTHQLNAEGLKKHHTLEQRWSLIVSNRERLKRRRDNAVLRFKEMDIQSQTIMNNFLEQYGENILTCKERYSLTGFEQVTAELAKSKARESLTALGDVNLLAVEEYETQKSTYDYHSQQRSDIEQARDELQTIITETQKISEKLFVETVNEIESKFKLIFKRLFGGGNAGIKLTNKDDPLTSGLDILVQPPHKKLQSVSLLSGGEKTMTALALMFATFQVRPSPICLLDEVDAALDDANINRFVSLLSDFVGKTQFLIITHNRKTVSIAESVYGITMEEPGITKVLSLKLNQQEEV